MDLLNGVESSTPIRSFSLGKRKKSQGARSVEYGGWGICHVLGQKMRNFKGPVNWGIAMDNEVLVLPFVWPVAPHIFAYPS